jgi:hypothetical protein
VIPWAVIQEIRVLADRAWPLDPGLHVLFIPSALSLAEREYRDWVSLWLPLQHDLDLQQIQDALTAHRPRAEA